VCQDNIGIGDGLSAQGYFTLVYENNIQLFYKYFNIDGILGLGFSGLSGGYSTFVSSLKAAGVINRALFAMYLNHLEVYNSTQGYGNPSSNLEIGSYNLSKYSSTNEILVNVSIINPNLYSSINPGFWQAVFDTANIGGVVFTMKSFIFDSGTSLIAVDANSYSQIFKHYNSKMTCSINGAIFCECSPLIPLDSFSFVIDGKNLTVPSERLWLRENGQCILLIQTSGNLWILGDIFLVNYYAIYDMDNLVVSLAPAVSAGSGCINIFIGFILILSLGF
jgi:Eukaryotic aspartyl protease